MKQWITAILCSLIVCVAPSVAPAQSLANTLFVTENLVPFNFKENGLPRGIGIDALMAALDAVGVKRSPGEIQFYPWARAYYLTLGQPNTCLFVTYRSPEREAMFKWVGPITDFRMTIITRKGGRPIDTMEKLKATKVGVLRNGAAHQRLITKGFSPEHIEQSFSVENLIELLEYGRIDAAFMNDQAAQYRMQHNNMDWNDYEIDLVAAQGAVYFAFNRDTPDETVNELQRGMDIIRDNGTLQQIIKSYQ
jgi:ABC-type amino acid transport substrate-binding protein